MSPPQRKNIVGIWCCLSLSINKSKLILLSALQRLTKKYPPLNPVVQNIPSIVMIKSKRHIGLARKCQKKAVVSIISINQGMISAISKSIISAIIQSTISAIIQSTISAIN